MPSLCDLPANPRATPPLSMTHSMRGGRQGPCTFWSGGNCFGMIQGLPECPAVGRGGQDGGTAPRGGLLRHIKVGRLRANAAGAPRPLAPPPAKVMPRHRRSRGVSREHERAGATLRTASTHVYPIFRPIAISSLIQMARQRVKAAQVLTI